MSRAHRIAAGALLALLTLGGCGSGGGVPDDPGAGSPQPGAGDVVQEGVHNEQDVAFAGAMVVHHRQGIEMARLAQGRTTNPQVLAVAAQVESEHTPELAEMTRWLGEWGRPVPGASPSVGGIAGLASPAQLAELRAAKDAAFDRLFLTLLVAHQEGGVSQSRDEQRTGADERARGLAEDMAVSEGERVVELRKLLG